VDGGDGDGGGDDDALRRLRRLLLGTDGGGSRAAHGAGDVVGMSVERRLEDGTDGGCGFITQTFFGCELRTASGSEWSLAALQLCFAAVCSVLAMGLTLGLLVERVSRVAVADATTPAEAAAASASLFDDLRDDDHGMGSGGRGGLCPISYLDHATLPPDAAGTPEHVPWHYCAFIVRVLATPPEARTRPEARVATALAADRVAWLPLGRAMSLDIRAAQQRAAAAKLIADRHF